MPVISALREAKAGGSQSAEEHTACAQMQDTHTHRSTLLPSVMRTQPPGPAFLGPDSLPDVVYRPASVKVPTQGALLPKSRYSQEHYPPAVEWGLLPL